MKTNNSCLKLSVAALMILLPVIAWGGGTKYTYSATLKAESLGHGKVYVSKSNASPTDEQWKEPVAEETSSSGETTETSWTVSLYAHAKADDGYEFSNWDDGSKVNPKTETFNMSSSAATATRTVKASFSAIQYKITYELDGGTGTAVHQTYDIAATGIILHGAPTRPGYSFGGWKASAPSGASGWENGKVYHPGSMTMHKWTGNITLTAVWTADDYKIGFEPNGGAFAAQIQNPLPYNITFDKIGLPEITREEYTFTGWRVSSIESEDYGGWGPGATYSGSTIVTGNAFYGNVFLTAGWTKEAAPGYVRVNISGLKNDHHAIFNVTYGNVTQQISIHGYAVVKIPGNITSVTVTPSGWTERTYTITTEDPDTKAASSGTTTVFDFKATPKQGRNIFETSREF